MNRIDPTGHSWISKFFKKNPFIGKMISAMIGMPELFPAVTGKWKEFAIESAATLATIFLPGSGTISSNFLMNVGLHAARGAAIGAITGGLSSIIMGGKFGDGAQTGAIWGGATGTIQGITTSEQFRNWQTGRGFVLNSTAHKIDNLQAQLQSAETKNITNTYGKFTLSVKNGGNGSGMGGSGNGWGHSWGTLEDNLGNTTSYGFWPDGAGKEAITGKQYVGTVTHVPGALDGVSHADAAYTWNISQSQYSAMVNYANNFSGSWSLSVNCTDFAVGMARAGGINISGNYKTFGYSDPNKLGEILESMNKK